MGAPLTVAALLAAAEAEGNRYAVLAIGLAEDNAHDTVAEGEATNEDVERLTLDSIAYTSPFNEVDGLSEWFRAKGYRW